MTWQGGKRGKEAGPMPVFARLKPLVSAQDDAAKAFEKLAQALSGYANPVRLHVRLVGGNDRALVEHWEIVAGAKKAKLHRSEPKDADVIVVMKAETWTQIAQGRLAPYEALYSGKLRVGGDFQAAKEITRHLSDPTATYVAPC